MFNPGGISVEFRIGMLSTTHWLKILQRAKKVVETLHFVKLNFFFIISAQI